MRASCLVRVGAVGRGPMFSGVGTGARDSSKGAGVQLGAVIYRVRVRVRSGDVYGV